MNQTITAVPGLHVGHYTDLDHATGCTVFLCPRGGVGGVDVRGGSPGTRETDLLRPVHRVDQVHAVVLSGGSAFGLDAASGVAGYLAEREIGLRVGPAIVPIVPAAILFDLRLITSKVRPGPGEGAAACRAASAGPMAEGTIGAGTGATVAKTKGFEAAVKSGIGSAVVRLPEGPLVAAAVAVNAYGGVYDYQSGQVVAGPRKAGGYGFEDTMEHLLQYGIPDESPSPEENPSLENTSIGLVATDAQLTKEEANYLARVSHDGLALTIRPCHTDRDGDTMFALATGDYSQGVNLTRLGAAAVEATAQAVLRAVRTATGLGGLPAVGEVPGA